MRKLTLALVLALAGCSNQEAGQSTYLENPEPMSAEAQTAYLARQAEVDRILAANLAGQSERRRLANEGGDTIFVGGSGFTIEPARQTGDDASLVASLEAAIESAGSDEEITPPAVAQPLPEAIAVTAQPEGATAPSPQNGTGTISDNSFTTVTQRESIESDAQRLAGLSRERVVLEAEPLPSATTSANLAAFARATQHRIGQRVYPRGRSERNRAQAARTCRSYGNPDEAQRAFLSAGGPDTDPMGLDPDGDGFVCGWSPEPFRSLTIGQG